MEELELTAEKFSFVFTELKSNSKETLFEFKFNQQGLDLISGVERKIYIFKRLIPIFYYQKILPIIKNNKILDYCFLVLNPNHISG